MNHVQQAVAAAILAGSMALTFGGIASADGPTGATAQAPAAGGSIPTGSVRFVVNGPTTAPVQLEKVEIAVEKMDRVMRMGTDNEWKYIAVRRY